MKKARHFVVDGDLSLLPKVMAMKEIASQDTAEARDVTTGEVKYWCARVTVAGIAWSAMDVPDGAEQFLRDVADEVVEVKRSGARLMGRLQGKGSVRR